MVPSGAIPLSAPTASPPAARALAALWGRSPGDPLLAVDPRDEMLAFLRGIHDDDPDQALCTYYRTGHEIAEVLLQVLRWRFGPSLDGRTVLDFASGWGRVTRFLVPALDPARLWVSDVMAEAVAFQQQAFGVRGAVSALRPEDLSLDGPFDGVTVTSLFTHLPEQRFGDWLATLWRRLAPGGVMMFSTHDSALHPTEGVRGGAFVFEPFSENRALSCEDYGTTWVSETFVRGALATACPGASAARLSRALCNFQDLWVVVPGSASFDDLAVQSEPELMVDRSVVEDGELVLRGWALARQGGVRTVEVLADGEVLAAAPVNAPRPDVAAALGQGFGASGWSCRCPLPARETEGGARGRAFALRVIDAAGGAHVLRVGPLDVLLASFRAEQVRGLEAMANSMRREEAALRQEEAARRRETDAELARLRGRVAAMEASRFWKLRNAWFALKRALRLTDER